MSQFEEYANKYETMNMQRRNGILEVTFHVNAGPLVWNEPAHREIGHACVDIGPTRRIKS